MLMVISRKNDSKCHVKEAKCLGDVLGKESEKLP